MIACISTIRKRKEEKNPTNYYLYLIFFTKKTIRGGFLEFILSVLKCMQIFREKTLYFFSLAFSGIFISNGTFACMSRSCRNHVFDFVSQSSNTVVKLHLASKRKFIFVFLLTLNVIHNSHYTCQPSARLIRVNNCCTDPKERKGKGRNMLIIIHPK